MVFQKNKKRIETKDPDFRELFEKMQKENRIDSTLYKEAERQMLFECNERGQLLMRLWDVICFKYVIL